MDIFFIGCLWWVIPSALVTLLTLGIIWVSRKLFGRKTSEAARRAAMIMDLLPPDKQRLALIELVKILEQARLDIDPQVRSSQI